jgi:predicted DNA-binding transcriptional regulator AlpA
MDAPVTTTRLPAASEIFRRLEEDPEAAIREMVHLMGDLYMDRTFNRIRSGDSTHYKALPPVEAPAVPAPVVDVVALQTRIAKLAGVRDAMQRRAEAAEADWQACEKRIQDLEAANRNLQDMIAQISGGIGARAAAKPNGEIFKPREMKRGRDADAPVNAAIGYEDRPATAPSAIVSSDPARPAGPDLITSAGVRALLGLRSTGSISCIKRRDASFPKPAGKKGRAEVYLRSEIDAWLRQRTPPAKNAPGPDMIHIGEVCELLSDPGHPVKKEMVSYHLRNNKFPPPAAIVRRKYFWDRSEVEAWVNDWRGRRRNPAGVGRKKSPPLEAATTCATCADLHTLGKRSICGSESSPHKHTSRAAAQTCDYHRKPAPPYRPARPDNED